MKKYSIWKNVLLLSFTSVLFFHIAMANAADDNQDVKSSGGDEECVITDDQI